MGHSLAAGVELGPVKLSNYDSYSELRDVKAKAPMLSAEYFALQSPTAVPSPEGDLVPRDTRIAAFYEAFSHRLTCPGDLDSSKCD